MTDSTAKLARWAAPLALLGALAACGGGARSGDVAPRLAAGDSASAACPTDSAAPRDADLEITATVRARSLEHRVPPRADVSFPGTTGDTLSCDTRRNLERPVRAGRTYRDVEVRYRMSVRLDTALARLMGDSVAAGRDTARSP
jgi:hypothetical protein